MAQRTLLTAFVLGSLVLAGCTTGDKVEAPDTTKPAPEGTALTNPEIRDFIKPFDDQPFLGGQGSPEHVLKWVTDDTFIGLHFMGAEDPKNANMLNWIVVGVKGVFCAEAQPGGPASGFTHFHKASSATWDAGHGGQAGDQGYWLLHVAVDDFTAPWGGVTPGTDYGFMPTEPPECGTTVPAVDIAGLTEDNDLSKAERDALLAVFDDQPFQGGQETPEHVWKWVNPDAFVFLHWNHADPESATALNWFGVGVRGQFCDSKQPHDDFTHHHRWASPTWDAGHGGKARDYGYWLQHNAVREFTAPWGDVEPGVDREFMPTEAPDC